MQAQIGEKNSYEDWGLELIDVDITAPEVQTKYVAVPGRNGLLDLTESLAPTPRYLNRILTMTFVLVDKSMSRWSTTDSIIKNDCHGQARKIILDYDPGYYWYGRCTVATSKEDAVHSRFVIEANVQPFKYDVQTSIEDWLWDPFNFETGVIREVKDIQITTNKMTVEILGSGLDVVPIFVVSDSDSLALSYNGKSYPLPMGSTRLPEVRVGGTTQTLTFTGTGTLSIDFRGRSL